MKRWNLKLRKNIENPSIDAFLQDISKVCEQHHMSISHEDIHGAFIVEDYSQDNIEWLMNAFHNINNEVDHE